MRILELLWRCNIKLQIELLLEEIRQLREENARLRKDSSNSSKPPSSDIVKPKRTVTVSRKKRSRGGQGGHRRFTRGPFAPEQVDQVIEYEFTQADARGLEPLDEWQVLQQVVLPEKMVNVIEHRARCYRDPLTGRTHIAPLPRSVRKLGLLGADATAMIAMMKGACHMSYSTIQTFLKEVFKLDVSRGMLCKTVLKVSQAMAPAVGDLTGRVRQETHLGIDETGHHDIGKLHWTWCFNAPAYSVFSIWRSRGSDVLKAMLGDEFHGTINADFYGAYRKFSRELGVPVQYCMAHLIREIRFLAEHPVKSLSRWGQGLLDWLKKLFDTLHRRETLTPAGYGRSMRRIKAEFLKRMHHPPDHGLARKLSRRFRGEAAEAYFRFLDDAGVEPTNNNTERQIRPVVIDRRITQGTRGDAGMRWSERIWTVLTTCKKQQRNVFDFIHESVAAHWSRKTYPLLIPVKL